ncbi:MAG TPA: hypothetical protein VN372_01520 [Methanospirillum sp.]|nr:hypothetical protein [Methanospirillum sp.]
MARWATEPEVQVVGCCGARIRANKSKKLQTLKSGTEHNFILIDERTSIFELEDQRNLIRPYIMIRVRDALLNSQLRDVFQMLWEKASPLSVP